MQPFPYPTSDSDFTIERGKETSKFLLPRNGCPPCAGEFCVIQASIIVGKETYTARRNRIQPKLVEALQALKYTYRSGLLNPTERLSDGFHPLENNMPEECGPLKGTRRGDRTPSVEAACCMY